MRSELHKLYNSIIQWDYSFLNKEKIAWKCGNKFEIFRERAGNGSRCPL